MSQSKIEAFMGTQFTGDATRNWNIIMMVVGAIEQTTSQKYGGFHVHIDKDCCLIQSKNRTKESGYSKMYCGNGDKRKAVVESILTFIDFANENSLS